MEMPHADMARHTVEEQVTVINHQKAPARPTRRKFDCALVLRQSVGACKSGTRAKVPDQAVRRLPLSRRMVLYRPIQPPSTVRIVPDT